MLDVHVLIHPDTPRDWVSQCLDSVYTAADHAGYPVAVHPVRIADECPQALGHIGRGRLYGYGLGEHPYVTSVDDDDWIEPEAFAVLADAMVKRPAGIATRLAMHDGERVRYPAWREHLRVFRRDVAASAPLADWPAWDGLVLMDHADTCGAVVELPDVVYHYRVHLSPSRRLTRSLPAAVGERMHRIRYANAARAAA